MRITFEVSDVKMVDGVQHFTMSLFQVEKTEGDAAEYSKEVVCGIIKQIGIFLPGAMDTAIESIKDLRSGGFVRYIIQPDKTNNQHNEQDNY